MAFTVSPGKPFYTGVWAFAINMSGLFVVDSIDVFTQPIVINNWLVAALLSLIFAIAMWAKAKVDEFNGNHKNGKLKP